MKTNKGLQSTVLAISLVFALAAKAQVPAEAAVTYTVQSRDNLIRIASKVLIHPDGWPEVARMNRIRSPDDIVVGQKIQIPLRLMKWTPNQARLISANGDVQINGASATVGAALSEGDRLHAGASSSALIKMDDGSRIQIMPGSVAELVNHRQYGLKDGSPNINWFSGLLRLTKGAVEAIVSPGVERATPLQVTTPTSLVGVRGTHFRVAFDAQARSEVMEGLVVAENTAQAVKADLPAGNGAVIRPEEKTIQVKRLLAAPDLNALPAQLHGRQSLSWPKSDGAEAWRVQLAADADFSQIFFEGKVTVPALEAAGLPLGHWHARVRAIDKVGLEGFDAARKIEIVAAPAPIWTLDSSTLSFREGRSRLSWTAAEPGVRNAAQWRAEILKDGAVVVAAAASSAQGSFIDFELASGVYTVRIDGQDAQGIAFRRQIFQLEIPDGWGTHVRDLIDPLQSSR